MFQYDGNGCSDGNVENSVEGTDGKAAVLNHTDHNQI